MARFESILKGLGAMIVSSIVLIALALVYFLLTAWIVSFGVDLATGSRPSADFVALAAAILSFGGLAGSTVRSMGPSAPQHEDDYAGQEVA